MLKAPNVVFITLMEWDLSDPFLDFILLHSLCVS